MTDRKHNCSANQVENTELQIGKLRIIHAAAIENENE